MCPLVTYHWALLAVFALFCSICPITAAQEAEPKLVIPVTGKPFPATLVSADHQSAVLLPHHADNEPVTLALDRLVRWPTAV